MGNDALQDAYGADDGGDGDPGDIAVLADGDVVPVGVGDVLVVPALDQVPPRVPPGPGLGSGQHPDCRPCISCGRMPVR